MSADDLRGRIAADMPRTIADLERLVRIPSKGYPGDDPANVRASAEATRDILVAAGVADARLLELDGGHPAVFGQIDGPPGCPHGAALRPSRRPTGGTHRAVGLTAVRARGA